MFLQHGHARLVGPFFREISSFSRKKKQMRMGKYIKNNISSAFLGSHLGVDL